MMMLLPIVIALVAADPTPAASTAPRPTPLQEIGRVRALPACVPIVTHANAAITQALDNDRTLAILSTNLHNTDFDKLNSLQRRNVIDALMKQAEALRVATKAADGEVKKLREYAVNAPDEQRKVELKTFADALGGALNRQQKAASEFMRDVTIVRGREVVANSHETELGREPIPPSIYTTSQVPLSAAPTPEPAQPFNTKQMQYLGDTLDALSKTILIDEGKAADHSIAATSGC